MLSRTPLRKSVWEQSPSKYKTSKTPLKRDQTSFKSTAVKTYVTKNHVTAWSTSFKDLYRKEERVSRVPQELDPDLNSEGSSDHDPDIAEENTPMVG